MPVLVKICGITNLEDARTAVAAGADFLGFIFVPGTPRQVTPEQAAAVIGALRAEAKTGGKDLPRFVGVFRDAPLADILATAGRCGLDLIQLHGQEPPELARELGPERVWKALALRTPQEVEAATAWPAAAVLADSPGGGTGQSCDWALAAALAARRRLVLAGGLTPENVAAAVREVRPWAVDVGSGVEAAKGKKDPAKVRAFVVQARCGCGDAGGML
ncbi:MAG: phosphoribosylanthranilate isomerase [Lentisphaeria bacterium]|jgi:phosphoribosylanthranilate isomerase